MKVSGVGRSGGSANEPRMDYTETVIMLVRNKGERKEAWVSESPSCPKVLQVAVGSFCREADAPSGEGARRHSVHAHGYSSLVWKWRCTCSGCIVLARCMYA